MNEVLKYKKINYCFLMFQPQFFKNPPQLPPVILKIIHPCLTWPPDPRGLVEVSALYPPEAAGQNWRSWRLQELY